MRIRTYLLAFVLAPCTILLSAQNMPAPSQQSEQPTAKADVATPKTSIGGVEILSDTQGVDFSDWLVRWHQITELAWNPLIPKEVNSPTLLKGVVAIRFKVLPSGQVIDLQLKGRSGTVALDRAAWGAITGSSYPNLPREFHGPYIELRAHFLYNTQPK